ncbi:hypothetical protein [Sphingomonas oryzagri]
MDMKLLIAAILTVALPSPLLAQHLEDPHNNLFADHNSGGNNGSHRVGARLGTQSAKAPAMPSTTLIQPARSGVQVYKPRSLNDLARDWAKAHPNDLPNRRKPDPQ